MQTKKLNLTGRLTAVSNRSLAKILILGFIIMIPFGLLTEALFAEVNYPGAGDFGGVPLSFDVDEKQRNLDILDQQDTLDLFVIVQIVDFGIVIGTLLVFTSIALLLTKRIPEEKTSSRKIGLIALLALCAGPLCDALENISLVIIIANRGNSTFTWLDYLNSFFTLGKTVFFVIGWILLIVILVLLVWGRVKNPGSQSIAMIGLNV
ncbi:MAG: hypothetical protein ACE5OZ_01395 [Candidatus Heimdallarchaeota archaeon]